MNRPLLARIHRLMRAPGNRFRQDREANQGECHLARQYRRQVVRLRRLNEKNQHPVRMEKLEHHFQGVGPVVRHYRPSVTKLDPGDKHGPA
jgi:hypothetical protein